MTEPVRKIRSIPAILAPFASITRDVVTLFRNPLAMIGGALGTIVMSAAVILGLVLAQEAEAFEPEDEELDMEFLPGELVRKGPKLPEEEIPEKIIVEETVAADTAVEETVTKKEEKIEPPPEEKKEKPKKDKKKSKEKPDPNKKNKKVAEKNQDSNTPYDDLPTVKELPGDPFGSAKGWSDRAKKGDPWATAVIAALNKVKLPAYAAQGQKGSVKFQITICKDGRIQTAKVNATKGIDKKVFQNEVSRIKLPRPPAELQKQLKGKCKKIPYKFVWVGGPGGGKVK